MNSPGAPAGGMGFRRGCFMGLVILALIGTGMGYMWWRTYSKYIPPKELKDYAYRESTMNLIKSKAPAPGPDARLTQGDVNFFIGVIDSIDNGWELFRSAYDSARSVPGADTSEKFNPLDLDELGVLYWQGMLYARRGLVNYLNTQRKSWEEYLWAKHRVIAVSGITREEMLDSVHAFMVRFAFDVSEEDNTETGKELFEKIDQIRSAGIDSTERNLVAPHREYILTDGIHTLTDIEEAFYGE